MASNFYPRLSNLFNINQLPAGLQVLQPAANAVQDVLEKVHYRNLLVQPGSSAFSLAASLELVSYQALRLDITGSGFNLVLNPEETAAEGITTLPLAFSYSLGIAQFLPLFDSRQLPTSAEDLFALWVTVTGATEAQLLRQASLSFEGPTDASTSPLTRLAQRANTAFGTAYGLSKPMRRSTACAKSSRQVPAARFWPAERYTEQLPADVSNAAAAGAF